MDIAPVRQEGFPPAAESLQPSGITATIKEVLRGDVEPTLTNQCLYLVSRYESILYVGQSQNPVNRLKEHLGLRRSAESNLGLLIFCNLPVSLSWQMHFLSLIDSEPCLADYLAIMYERQAEIAKARRQACREHSCLHKRRLPCIISTPYMVCGNTSGSREILPKRR